MTSRAGVAHHTLETLLNTSGCPEGDAGHGAFSVSFSLRYFWQIANVREFVGGLLQDHGFNVRILT